MLKLHFSYLDVVAEMLAVEGSALDFAARGPDVFRYLPALDENSAGWQSIMELISVYAKENGLTKVKPRTAFSMIQAIRPDLLHLMQQLIREPIPLDVLATARQSLDSAIVVQAAKVPKLGPNGWLKVIDRFVTRREAKDGIDMQGQVIKFIDGNVLLLKTCTMAEVTIELPEVVEGKIKLWQHIRLKQPSGAEDVEIVLL